MKDWVDSSTWSGDKENGQLTDNRILHCRSHYYDWCSAVSKNATRDHIRFAQVAYVELTLTEQYWKKLLSKTKSAAFLRREIAELLSSHCKPKSNTGPSSSKGTKVVKQYTFPDGLTTKEIKQPVINVQELVSTQNGGKPVWEQSARARRR